MSDEGVCEVCGARGLLPVVRRGELSVTCPRGHTYVPEAGATVVEEREERGMTRNSFGAVTWNVFAGTAASKLVSTLAHQRLRGVNVGFMQEAGGADITAMLEDQEWATYVPSASELGLPASPQWRVFWDPKHWVAVDERAVLLSPTAYFGKASGAEQHSYGAAVILCDSVGRSLTAVSYHMPSHVQVPKAERPERRYRSLLESMRELGHLAEDAQSTGFLAAGDDNWDENTGLQTPEATALLLGSATGLRQIQSPAGTTTEGKRQIDDFRILRHGRLRPGVGWVESNASDHKLHGRVFDWRL